MNTGIYKITNLNNGKFYIGQSRNIPKRWKSHTQHIDGNSDESLIRKAFAKYGLRQQVSTVGTYTNFKFEIIHVCSPEELNKWEFHYIQELKPDYNIQTLPPNPDYTFKEKEGVKHWIQYHSIYQNGTLPAGEALEGNDKAVETVHYISTKKRSVINSKGDIVYLIIGAKIERNPKTQYFIWSKTYIEEIDFLDNINLSFNISGDQYLFENPIHLNSVIGFEEFRKKMGNFAYGFQSIAEDDPMKNLFVNLTNGNYLSDEALSYKDYVNKYIETIVNQYGV